MIYFDNAATSKVSEEVIADITESLRNDWANPSSISEQGMEVKRKIEHARKQIADYVNAEPEEIIFVASGSEANNLAIKGFLDANLNYNVVLSSTIEHPSVYNTCYMISYQSLDTKKYLTPFIDVDDMGLVNQENIEWWLNEYNGSCLVSIMMANNEIGTIEPIKELSNMTHKYKGVMHTDATQAFGKIPIDVKDLDVDLMSVSLHKCGLPRGVAFLYKKKGIALSPIIHGGHQEMNYRAGTENTAYIIAAGNQVERMSFFNFGLSVKSIRNYLLNQIWDKLSDYNIHLNGVSNLDNNRLPNILSLTFKGVNAETLITLLDMKGVQVSAGSACSSYEKTPSRILKAIGLSDEEAFSTIRISISEDTTVEECDEFVRILGECLQSLKMIE